jgi:hypothetical protein
MSPQIFISHAESDKEIALRLYDDLAQAGLSPWMAEKDLLPGQNRQNAIRKAIRGSQCFLALLSEDSVSKRGQVQREFKIAKDFQDEHPADGIFIIPVRVEDCEAVDPDMQELQSVDLFQSYEEGLDRLLRAIQSIEKRSSSDGEKGSGTPDLPKFPSTTIPTTSGDLPGGVGWTSSTVPPISISGSEIPKAGGGKFDLGDFEKFSEDLLKQQREAVERYSKLAMKEAGGGETQKQPKVAEKQVEPESPAKAPSRRTTDGTPIFPKTTLAIILGASAWPKWEELGAHEAFRKSAEDFEGYLLNEFGLPEANLRNFFDAEIGPDALDEAIDEFLATRKAELKAAGTPATDLLMFYTGHGNFQLGNDDFFLALRNSRKGRPDVSALRMTSLAATLKEQARHLRRFLILDCCFAAAAGKYLQSGAAVEAVAVQTMDAFKEMPKKGTALLCSSSAKTPSEIAPDGAYTMFSEALLYALKSGHAGEDQWLSISSLAWLIRGYLKERYQDAAVRPEVHSPDQGEGDIGLLPLFPNQSFEGSIPPSPELDLDESRFIESLFERFYTYNLVILLGQAQREQPASRELLWKTALERYGPERVLHLVPLSGESVETGRYFADLGRQCKAETPITDGAGLIEHIDGRMAEADRLFILVNGFEGGPKQGSEELAGAFRNLTERHGRKLHILICGGEKLAELSIFGELSMLTAAKIEEWPELTVADIQALHPKGIMEPATAQHILEMTGGHPRLVQECMAFFGSDGRFDDIRCKEALRNSRFIERIFLPFSRQSDKLKNLKKLLKLDDVGVFSIFIQDDILRRLYWMNLLRKNNDGKRLRWRCPLIRQIGESVL